MSNIRDMEEREVDSFFGQNLETLRKVGGFSRQQLIESLRDTKHVTLHATTLRRIEAGEQQPKLFEAIAIADFFHRDVKQMSIRPLDEAEAENYRIYDRLVEADELIYSTARNFREWYGRARRLIERQDPGLIESSSILKKIRALLGQFEEKDALAKRVVTTWNRHGSR